MNTFPKMLYTENLKGEKILMSKTKFIVVGDEEELDEKLSEGYRVELVAKEKPKRKRRTKEEMEAAKEAEEA